MEVQTEKGGLDRQLWAGEGEQLRMAARWGMELGCWLALGGVMLDAGPPMLDARPPPPTLWGPMGPTGGPTDPGWAKGLATGREGGVPICVWRKRKRTSRGGREGRGGQG